MNDIAVSIWLHWHGHPNAMIGLILIQVTYLAAIGPLRKRYSLSNSVNPQHPTLFSAGILVILISILSPLHILSDKYLFSAHMIQHVLLTLLAPPLLVLGTPGWLISPLLKSRYILAASRRLTHPITAIVTFNFIFSVWHVPALYTLAVRYHDIHVGEHVLFMLSAIIMWMPIYSNVKELPRLSNPLQMIYLFIMSIAQIIVFGMVTFSPEALYSHYIEAPRLWNISPLVDQQIGGIIMKVGSGFLFLGLLILAFFRWYREETVSDSQPGGTSSDE